MKGLRLDVEGAIGTLALSVRFESNGEPLVLVGPNGSGKTSVLLMVLGALRPSSGTIELDGEPLFDSGRRIDLSPEVRGLGYVPQSCGLFPHLTGLANVAFGIECRGRLRAAEVRERALGLLEELEVAHLADRLPASFSGGEAQRVALARALGSEPRALLLDEPFAALDASVRRQLRAFLPERLRALGLPCIVVTHDAADAAAFGCEIAVLERGRIAQRARFGELRAAPASDFVRELVGDPPSATNP